LRQPLLQTAMLIYLCVPGVFMGINLVAALYLQGTLGLSATATGGLMLPWAAGALAAIALSRWRFNALGPRPLLLAGMGIQSLAVLALASPWLVAHPGWLVLLYALLGLGSSLCSSTAQSSAFIQIADRELADASALWNINRQLSFCLGVTLLNLLFNLIANTGLPTEGAYHLTFGLAACSAVIPLLCCYRLNNHRVLYFVNQEQQ